jgi:hypothetical protein
MVITSVIESFAKSAHSAQSMAITSLMCGSRMKPLVNSTPMHPTPSSSFTLSPATLTRLVTLVPDTPPPAGGLVLWALA